MIDAARDNQQGLIAVRASPLLMPEEGRISLSVPDGSSLAEIVARALPMADEAVLNHVRVTVVGPSGMIAVEREWWSKVRPRMGSTVVVRVIPSGDQLRSILSIVVSIAALAVTTFLAPPLAQALALTGTAAKLFTGALSIGTLLVGTLVVNALVPPPEEPGPPKSNFMLTGWRNSLNPGGVVPCVLGKIRYAPPFAVKPYTEIVAGKQYINAVFNYGYGRLEFSKHRIGETPVGEFDNVRIYERRGLSGDNKLTAFPRQVLEEPLGIELVCPLPRNNKGEITGDNGTPTPVLRTLARDCNRAGLIFLFPQGLVRIENDGDERTVTMSIRVRSRPIGESDWSYEKTLKINKSTRDPFYVQHRWPLTPRGNHEVQVTRMTDESESTQKLDRVSLVAIQSFRPEYPLNAPYPLALVGVRIKASYQLSGALDNFNSVVSRVIPDWDAATETWIDRETSNPASKFRFVLQGLPNAKPWPDAGIDLDELQDWHAFCVAKGLSYDRGHDFEGSLESVLRSIAAAGRASPRFDGRKWSVVIDRPQSVVVDQVNPRNSSGMSWNRSYLVDRPDGFRVPFLDRTNDFKSAERIVPWPGVSIDDVVKTERLDLPGKTHPDEIWREARRHMHSRRYRPDEIRVTQDGVARVATRGDQVMLNYDVLVATQKAAAVVSAEGGLVELDDTVTMSAGSNYAIRWQAYGADDVIGESIVRQVRAVDGEYRAVLMISSDRLPAPGTIVHFGTVAEESEPMVVRDVETGRGGTSILSLVATSDLIDADTDAEVPPAWTGRVGDELSGIDEPGAPVITRILSGVNGTGDRDGLIVQLVDSDESDVAAETFDIDHCLFGAPAWTTVTIDVADGALDIDDYEHGDTVEIRARGVTDEDVPGPYCDVIDFIMGETDVAIPEALPEESIVVTGGLGSVSIEGVAGDDTATLKVQVYRSASSDPGDLTDADKIGAPFVVAPNRPWTFVDGDPSRTNIVVRGDFSSGKGWTQGAGWSVGDGVASKAPGTESAIFRGASLVNNAWYRLRFDIEDYVAGTVWPRLAGGTPVDGVAVSANGRFYDRVQADAGNDLIAMRGDDDFDGSVDDFVMFRESAASLPQGGHFYFFEPLNGADVAGPLSSAFAVTVT